MDRINLILASASPRRMELLEQIGLPFKVHPSELIEPSIAGEQPVQYARDLAELKAVDIARKHPDALVIGADTIVLINDMVLGKPADADAAFEMLTLLSGKTHVVITAFHFQILDLQISETHHVSTRVHFRKLLESEITHYIETCSPFDKAGSYGIQDYSGIFVDSIEGCFYNVVGLPISDLYTRLYDLLKAHDLTLE